MSSAILSLPIRDRVYSLNSFSPMKGSYANEHTTPCKAGHIQNLPVTYCYWTVYRVSVVQTCKLLSKIFLFS